MLVTALGRTVGMKEWPHRTGWDHRFQQQIRFIPDSNYPRSIAWVVPFSHSHWKTQSAQAVLIAESTPFLWLQKCKDVLLASYRKVQNMDLKPEQGWRNQSSLPFPEQHWLLHNGKKRQDTEADGGTDTLLMDKCWPGFLLSSRLLSCLSRLLIPPSGRFCGSTALCNTSHAAGGWWKPPTLLQPEQWVGKGLQHCLMAHTYPTAMAWLQLSESQLGTPLNWAELGFSSKKHVLWNPFLVSALLASSRQKRRWSFFKDLFFWEHTQLSSASIPMSVLNKRQNLVLHMLIWAGSISRAIMK